MVGNTSDILASLARNYQLTEQQCQQFEIYAHELVEWNRRMNLTAITDMPGILLYHFSDSLVLADALDMSKISGLADVGTGAGFPGLALKIAFPHVQVTLIEVVQKKITFLQHMIEKLGLDGISVYPDAWRSFLRTDNFAVDVVTARASLQPGELVRLFKPSCRYNEATLVYWASKSWRAESPEKEYVIKRVPYTVGAKDRALVFFKKEATTVRPKG